MTTTKKTALVSVAEKIASKIVRGQLWFDRKFVKRYLGIETPLYKFWWGLHVENTQAKLDGQKYKCVTF